MKIKILLAFVASSFSLAAFAQKSESEMAVYAEKKGNEYYLIRLPKGKNIPNVYVYSNGETKPYKKICRAERCCHGFSEDDGN
ncbi:hypothetical protein ACFOEQ_02245 [Chryseobacterium arachidis]|uniref:hypothetical protein n=1 Tax=Chryseobacterium arachidis TaxID=1416778 RepID=UPI00361A3CC9